MKLIRLLFSVVALVVIVAVLAIGVLMVSVDPAKLKPMIAQAVKAQTGYDVVIDGRFTWSFYPRFGIRAEHIALMVPKQKQPFLDLHHVVFVSDLKQLLQGYQKLRGDIYISDITLFNLHAQKAHVGLGWQNQILTLQPLTALLYSGTFNGVAQGADLKHLPQWKWSANFSNVELKPLLLDISGVESKLKLSGLGNIRFQAIAAGKSREQVLNSLNGSASFSLQQGSVEGIDLNYLLKTADALMNNQPVVAPTANLNETRFDALKGTAAIKNGVLSTSDINLMSSDLSVTGAGSINLPVEAINIQLRVTPQKEARTQWVIPVMVTGNLYRPDVRLDATELNILIAKQQLDAARVRLREEIKQRVPGKTGELLQNILGN